MMRVVCKRNQPLLREEVRRPLDALTREAHLPGNVRHWKGLPSELDGAQHLPAGTREPQRVCQTVPGGQQQPMQAEHCQNQVSQRLASGRVGANALLRVLHTTAFCHNDRMLSRRNYTLADGVRPLSRLTRPQDEARNGHAGASKRCQQGDDDGRKQAAEAVVHSLPYDASSIRTLPGYGASEATSTCGGDPEVTDPPCMACQVMRPVRANLWSESHASGNINEEVSIYRYVTQGSFDAYIWQTLETKAKFIAQVLTGDSTVRQAEDIGAQELSYAEVKAIASGNPAVLTLAEANAALHRLHVLQKHHADEQFLARRQLRALPADITRLERRVAALTQDIATAEAHATIR